MPTFNLVPGHGAEFAPGVRPPHTLVPAMAVRDGQLVSVFGTMGGDAQPQILLQLIVRLFHHGGPPDSMRGPRRWIYCLLSRGKRLLVGTMR